MAMTSSKNAVTNSLVTSNQRGKAFSKTKTTRLNVKTGTETRTAKKCPQGASRPRQEREHNITASNSIRYNVVCQLCHNLSILSVLTVWHNVHAHILQFTFSPSCL